MKLAVLISLILIISCGKIKKEINDKLSSGVDFNSIHLTSDEYFDEFKDEFNSESIRQINVEYDLSLPINFTDFPDDDIAIARCVKNTYKYTEFNYRLKAIGERTVVLKEIIVNAVKFNKLSYIMKDYVIKHELGHCVLNRDHVEDVHSIMNSVIAKEYDYINDYNYYQSELFNY